nr:AMP-binding protein [Pseudonocardia sp. TRM90224]
MADRDGLADRGQPGRYRAVADQGRVADRAAARLDVQVLDTNGKPVEAGTDGAIVVKLPMPPGALPTLWNDDDAGFVSSYMSAFEGYYLTGDGGRIDADGYVYVMGRTDDVINVAGHRLSTGGMEEVLAGHPDVAECAVIGVADSMKGQVPCGFVVLKAGVERDEAELAAELVQMVRPGQRRRLPQGRRRRGCTAEDAVGEDPAQDHVRHRRRHADAPVPSTIESVDVLDALRPVLCGKAGPPGLSG